MIPAIAIIGSLILSVLSVIKLIKMNKYEFRLRTIGGVIQFSSYGAAQAHFLLKGVMRLVLVISIIVFLLAMCAGYTHTRRGLSHEGRASFGSSTVFGAALIAVRIMTLRIA
jgi:hypothetical protein